MESNIFNKKNLLTKKQIELILNTNYEYFKIILVDEGRKTERFYVSSQNSLGESVFEKSFIINKFKLNKDEQK